MYAGIILYITGNMLECIQCSALIMRNMYMSGYINGILTEKNDMSGYVLLVKNICDMHILCSNCHKSHISSQIHAYMPNSKITVALYQQCDYRLKYNHVLC